MYTGIRVKDMGMKLKERIPHFDLTGGEVAVVASEDRGPEIEIVK
jgi:hypothetical protein